MSEEGSTTSQNRETRTGDHRGFHQSDDTITIKKDSLWKYSTFILAATIIVMAFVMFSNDKSVTGNVVNTGGGQPTPNPPSQPPQPSLVVAEIDDNAVLGDEDAPVTIFEFTDYQCPFCEKHHSQTFPQIKTQYIDTGKVKYVSKHFPLTSIHSEAQGASEAVECVREKGGDEAFWEMNDKIFDNQQTLNRANLFTWAQELGYDISECLNSGKFTSVVQKDMQEAQAATCTGTPCFVVNGQKINGAQPFSAFQQVIEAELVA